METSTTALKRFSLNYKQKRAVNQRRELEIYSRKAFSKKTQNSEDDF